MSGYQEPTQEERWQEDNRWAVYPIEKVEAAIKNLSEAIAEARRVQAEAKRTEQLGVNSEYELDRLLCPGCFNRLPETYRDGTMTRIGHMWLDSSTVEPCLATPERKRRIKEYFAILNPRIQP